MQAAYPTAQLEIVHFAKSIMGEEESIRNGLDTKLSIHGRMDKVSI